ncbi:MAG: type II toxin-antitoxin system Phd/YefM family antitoxin [Stellaceae bacterium]
MQVNVFEAKNRLSQLIKLAQAGTDVVIAKRGQRVARLVPATRVGLIYVDATRCGIS